MKKRNIAALVIASIAVVTLIGAGVARCSMNTPSETPQEITDEIQQREDEAASALVDAEIEAAGAEGIHSLVGTTWKATDDPACTLSIVDGAFVEKTADSTTVTYWKLDSESEEDGVLTAFITCAKEANGATESRIAQVEGMQSDTKKISCDALTHTYESVRTSPKEITFRNITSEFASTFGTNEADAEAAVATRAAAVAPDANNAAWDGEVWIDCFNKSASTTFTLDDATATIISLTRDSNGHLEAL